MNERIKDFIKQATLIMEVKHEGYRGNSYTEQVKVFDKEKFAELIVQECANQATWHQDTKAKDIGGELLKYFGVQE